MGEAFSEITPACCGERMTVGAEGRRLLELVCAQCGEIVYVKKLGADRPQMIDD